MMIVRRKIVNPTLEALTYEDILNELTEVNELYYDFRGHHLYKGHFPNTYRMVNHSYTLEPGIILIMNRNEIVEMFYSLDAMKRKYEIGAI